MISVGVCTIVSIGAAWNCPAAAVVKVFPSGVATTKEKRAAEPYRCCDHLNLT
jgi:hypothetical protein